MARKLTMLSVVGIAVFYLVVAPAAAADAINGMGSMLAHAGHQIATFLKRLG